MLVANVFLDILRRARGDDGSSMLVKKRRAQRLCDHSLYRSTRVEMFIIRCLDTYRMATMCMRSICHAHLVSGSSFHPSSWAQFLDGSSMLVRRQRRQWLCSRSIRFFQCSRLGTRLGQVLNDANSQHFDRIPSVDEVVIRKVMVELIPCFSL